MLGNQAFIWVDSDYKISGTASNFTYNVRLPRRTQYDSVALLQASIPKSYYLVKSPYNTFTLTENGLNATITVPAGNYSMASFKTVLQALLIARSPRSYTYTITQPSTATEASTGKYTFTVSGNAGVQPSFTFPSGSELYLQMGFNSASTNTFSANNLISANVVDFNTTRAVLIKSDMIEGVGTGTHGSAVLQEIFSFNTSDFSNIGFANPAPQFSAKRLVSTQQDVATFIFTDLNDKQLDFNGGSVNFSLVFFKRDNYNELALQDLKMKYFNDLYGNQPKPDAQQMQQ